MPTQSVGTIRWWMVGGSLLAMRYSTPKRCCGCTGLIASKLPPTGTGFRSQWAQRGKSTDDRSHALRGSALNDALRHRDAERPTGMPTRSVGTIRRVTSDGAPGTKPWGGSLLAMRYSTPRRCCGCTGLIASKLPPTGIGFRSQWAQCGISTDDRSHALRGSALNDALRHRDAERPVCMPTQSVGTIRQVTSDGAPGTKPWEGA